MISGVSPTGPLLAYVLKDGTVGTIPIELYPGTTASGFTEGTHYLIQAPAEGFALRIDDAPLPSPEHRQGPAEWLWSPDFYAGTVNVELVDTKGRIAARFQIDVSPHPDKLGQDVFESMIEDIRRFAPALLLGSEPAQTWAGTRGDFENPFVQYVRLRAHADAFIAALNRVREKPLRELRQQRRLVRPQMVRRSDVTTVMAAARGTAAPALFRRNDFAAPESDPSESVVFDVPVSREELDCPANRCLSAALNAVALRVKTLITYFDDFARTEKDSARTMLRDRWPLRRQWAVDLLRKIRALQSSEPFCSVRHPSLSAEGLTAVSADPAYARAYRLGWRILRPGIDGLDKAERAWLSPTWEIYERWCFTMLAKLLEETLSGFEWTISTRHASNAAVSIHGTCGPEQTIELLLQPRFPAWDQASPAGFRSISGLRFPDIALTFSDASGRRCIIFDAKYRTSRAAVLDAMESAHIYRDALRIDEHPVECAVLLVPAAGGAPWLESLSFISAEKVGVLPLGRDVSAVRGWLNARLEESILTVSA